MDQTRFLHCFLYIKFLKRNFYFQTVCTFSLHKLTVSFPTVFGPFFEFSQIYSFRKFLKSETTEEFIYGLQPLSAGVGRKISVVFKRHWHCATFFIFSKPVTF